MVASSRIRAQFLYVTALMLEGEGFKGQGEKVESERLERNRLFLVIKKQYVGKYIYHSHTKL